jgi:xanthine dehydrogenase accessory factor
MKDILPDLETWLAAHETVALATVIQTWGSSPRGVGAKMALTPGGKITGSVSGGCVEGAVFEAGVAVLQTAQPQLLHFGVADETAWTVGLACGGQIDIFVQQLDENYFRALRKALHTGRSFAAATVIRGPHDRLGCAVLANREGAFYSTFPARSEQAIITAAQHSLSEGRSQRTMLQAGPGEELEVFIEVVEPEPVLIVVGAVHSAIALTRLAQVMGYRTVVIDPRRAFGNTDRFPQVGQLIQKWPDEAFEQLTINEKTAIAILTHDPKIDDTALVIALRSPAFYIGALGSATTQAKRRARMLEAGLTEQELARLHGPIGLKLGSRTPEEIALSVMAEITAVQNRVIQ